MKFLVIRFVHYLLKISNAHKYLENLRNTEDILEKNRNCICQGTLYPEASVFNLSKRRENINIGKHSHIRGTLMVFPQRGKIEIGDFVYVGHHSTIWSAESVRIGNNVLISHNVNIIDTDSHEIDKNQRREAWHKRQKELSDISQENIRSKPIVIEDDVWISFNVTILKGVSIGEGSIIGAGAIVTKSVPPNSIVKGIASNITQI